MKAITIAAMRAGLLLSILLLLAFPVKGTGASPAELPRSFGTGTAMTMMEEPGSWTPDTMYERVNGEAELLKRYGAVGLFHAAYEGPGGAYFSADLLDMGEPLNAFGLYRLYAGCDGQEGLVSGATVLYGDYTSYAFIDRYFMRLDFDPGTGGDTGRALSEQFLAVFSRQLPAPGPLPPTVRLLKKLAARPCEIAYHPEHIDYDLESGAGYSWKGPGGEIYFLSFLPSPDEAKVHAAVLRNRGAPVVVVWGNAVTWPREGAEGASEYLKGVLRQVVKW